MPRFWVVGEANVDGSIAKISTEVATLARSLAADAGAPDDIAGIVVAADPARAARELAAFVPRVLAVADPTAEGHAWAVPTAESVAAIVNEDADGIALIGAGPDGRDVAGTLAALTGRGVLANAVGVRWDGRLVVEMSAFGGNMVTAEPLGSAGEVVDHAPAAEPTLPRVIVRESVAEAGAAVPIEEARIIVSGGRGIGGPDGFELVRDLASELGGAVGATRAAVDSGWIPYSQQIGQTGKIVKPQLYLALGISGAIQHKVGMQTAETIIAVNRDPDAPISEFADLLVVGDLFEVGRALLVALRGRSG